MTWSITLESSDLYGEKYHFPHLQSQAVPETTAKVEIVLIDTGGVATTPTTLLLDVKLGVSTLMNW
jgi:hypothetical protein